MTSLSPSLADNAEPSMLLQMEIPLCLNRDCHDLNCPWAHPLVIPPPPLYEIVIPLPSPEIISYLEKVEILIWVEKDALKVQAEAQDRLVSFGISSDVYTEAYTFANELREAYNEMLNSVLREVKDGWPMPPVPLPPVLPQPIIGL